MDTNRNEREAAPAAVTCIGDGMAAGEGGFDWVGELARRPENHWHRFSNLGVRGDLAYNTLRRVQGAVDRRPGKVVVVVGHNDIVSLVFPKVRRVFRIWKRLPDDPSPEGYHDSIQAVVRRLKRETPAVIALVSLPPIGEVTTSPEPVHRELAMYLRQYNEIIRDVASEEGAAYIPFAERMQEQIAASPGRAFTAFRFWPLCRDTFRRFVLRRTIDEIAAANGWKFHVDGIRLNTQGGMILAGLVQEFLDG